MWPISWASAHRASTSSPPAWNASSAAWRKKVLIANNIGALWDVYAADPGNLTTLGAWLGILAFSLQIYFDFSGYSDMAVGLGRMIGFEFKENFNYPYISRSVTEFWRRWHISLGTWFRDYVYIPLGGNRRGLGRQLFNITVVWALTGIWHGANWTFLFWGLYYAVFLILEKSFLLRWLDRAPRAVGHVYTLFVVVCGWVLFQLEDMTAVSQYFAAMFGGGAGLVEARDLFYLVSYAAIFVIGAVAATPLGVESLPLPPAEGESGGGPGANRCRARAGYGLSGRFYLQPLPLLELLGGNREQKGALDRGDRVFKRSSSPSSSSIRPCPTASSPSRKSRSLQQRPAFSFDELFSGQYTKDFSRPTRPTSSHCATSG